ncbi:MAG: hypothetical protein ABIJ21_06785 [Nanoarchaeota archaeon]
MVIALEKILTMGTYDYMQLQNLYERFQVDFVGIHHSGIYDYENMGKSLKEFAEIVPDNAVAVTDLIWAFTPNSKGTSYTMTYFTAQYSGIAIVPKKDAKD